MQSVGSSLSVFLFHRVLSGYSQFSFSTWSFYVPLFGTLINLGLLYWKRHDHPLNFVLLSTFTLLEAFTLGVTVAFFDTQIVLQALYAFSNDIAHLILMSYNDHSLITLGVFLGLTLFTFQSKVCNNSRKVFTASNMLF
jgi:FtsH-binding integral membrane protein